MHRHKIYDTDPTFSINPITRLIKNETSKKITLIQHDHNSERFTFEIPRYIEEHDMSECNVVQVHYINIESGNKNQNEDVYDVTDLHISLDDDDKVICSWLISQNATKYVGSLNFVVRFSCVTDDVIDYAWNTAVHSGISVSSGIFNTDIVAEENSDIIASWTARIEALEQGGVGGGGMTDEQAAELAANTKDRHTHVNKSVLDSITQEMLDNIGKSGNPDDLVETHPYQYYEGSVVIAETEDEQRVIDAYNAMMSECMGDYNKIPFFAQADNHNYFANDLYKLCGKMINFGEFSKVITLGDVAGSYYNEKELQNFVDAMKPFPIEKKITVTGNHDVWISLADKTHIDQSKLSKYFKNYSVRRYGTNNYGVAIDDYFNVKYLLISNYDKGESDSKISTNQASFIVDELSKDDGYDIVILSHEPISIGDSTATALLEAGIYTTMGNYFAFIPSKNSFISMLIARKNKGNGTYTDDEGVQHTYDFTNCNSDLLCCFCGHTHVEGFDFINNELLIVAYGGMRHTDGHPMYFGYIDRKNRLLKYYRVAGDYSASVTVGLDKASATNMTLDKTEITMNIGELEVISPVFTPVTAGNQRVVWTSSNNAVATVKKGFVSGIAEGTTTITAVSEDGSFTATCLVTVGTPEEPEEPDIPDVPDEPDVPDKPASNLPSDYQEVEYIYTTKPAASHIPTTTTLVSGDKGYISVMTAGGASDQAFCGLSKKCEIYVTAYKTDVLGTFSDWQYTKLVSPTKGSPCEINTKYNIEFDITDSITDLFLMAYDEVNKYGMNGKMYSARFTRNGVDIYNFVPCYRKADGKIGMYDTVNNVFAEGVGELLKGADV